MNYAALATVTTKLLKQFGAPLKVTRGGVAVGTGFGVFGENKTALDDSVQGMQVATTTCTIFASRLTKSPEVGDIVTFIKHDYIIRAINITNPTATEICYELEVTYG